jgi:hypothetical protein
LEDGGSHYARTRHRELRNADHGEETWRCPAAQLPNTRRKAQQQALSVEKGRLQGATQIAVAAKSAVKSVASMIPEHAPGEHDISVLYPTLAEVMVDCEQGADVAAQTSTT